MELTGEDTGNGTHVARGGPRVLAGVVGAHHPLLRDVELEQFEVGVAPVQRRAAAGPTFSGDTSVETRSAYITGGTRHVDFYSFC